MFFASGGSDAVDTAGKLALRYWTRVERPEKHVIVHRAALLPRHERLRHQPGRASPPTAEGYGSADRRRRHRRPGRRPTRSSSCSGSAATRIAAFIGEPVIGAGGIFHPAPGYWERVQELCRAPRRAADRRRGDLRVRPAGHVVRVRTASASAPTWSRAPRASPPATCRWAPCSRHRGSRSRSGRRRARPSSATATRTPGHPAVCAAGLANLDIIEREGLVDRVARMESVLADAVEPLRSSAAGLGHPRGHRPARGRSRSTPRRAQPSPGLVDRIVAECRTLGVMTRGLAGHSLQLSPPFVITEDELATVASVIADALSRVSVRASV